MPITDFLGIDGFCVNAESAKDVYDAIDRMHTQIIDKIEFAETVINKRSPGLDPNIAKLRETLHILESAMEKLYNLI